MILKKTKNYLTFKIEVDGAKSIEELKKAYLNYFANSKEFLSYLKSYLEKGGDI